MATLTHEVQYRRKDQTKNFDPWHTMAAFDCEGAASAYCKKQGNDTWEYRCIEITEGAIMKNLTTDYYTITLDGDTFQIRASISSVEQMHAFMEKLVECADKLEPEATKGEKNG